MQTHLASDEFFQLVHLVAVALEQTEKAGLRTGGAFHAAQFDTIDRVFQIFVIHQKVLQPQRGALAHRGELRGLQMRESERGQPFVV